jgi:hypothetical protein
VSLSLTKTKQDQVASEGFVGFFEGRLQVGEKQRRVSKSNMGVLWRSLPTERSENHEKGFSAPNGAECSVPSLPTGRDDPRALNKFRHCAEVEKS